MLEKSVSSLVESGDVLFRYPFKIYYKKDTAQGDNILVISVPKRHFKRAVKRNLLKRRIREAFRANCGPLSDFHTEILVVYISDKVEEYGKISETVGTLIEKIVGVAPRQIDKTV